MKKISIVLVEDHSIVRQGVRALLEREPGFVIVGEAENGLQAVDEARKLCPDILVLDIEMPDINGIEVTRRVREFSKSIRIIILSMYENEAYVVEAFKKGANGYVLKGSSGSILVQAVHEVLAGHQYLGPPLTTEMLNLYMNRAVDSSANDPFASLTAREREVLHMAARGFSSSKIAKMLSISTRTVEVHRSNMMRKLSIHSKTELVMFAIQKGIVSLKQ
ncbi:MAG: response regulator transcription factor [Nitrospirae bacterium]|nr:response regulator transcription factor [Nitrospirota bacterium]